ncbi:hypothetical protein JCGZ_07985 [Jatropha curcas]|uniref:Uncharacterized protein n=1 Tax=Jatropha curcas TaxID=180498 RepID=A0A067J974_JATCU|nr:hypothetical protein JCGZ_07985 [Jatropha curcas]
MTARLQSWIQADPDFQRSDALSRRRVVMSHPVLRRYYLGERVDIQIRAFCPLFPSRGHASGIRYYPPDGLLAFREVSLESVDRLALPSEDITEVPVGLVNQMMELILGMQQELTSSWTHRAFDDQRRRRPRR